jgi:hypothetical protein
MSITRGDVLEVETAMGTTVQMRALGAPGPGEDFAVVWVSTEEAWQSVLEGSEDAGGLPWPVSAVHRVVSTQL